VEYILLDAGNNIISSVERKNVSTPDKFELNQKLSESVQSFYQNHILAERAQERFA